MVMVGLESPGDQLSSSQARPHGQKNSARERGGAELRRSLA